MSNELTIFKNTNTNLPAYDSDDCNLVPLGGGMSSGIKFIRLDGKEFAIAESGVKTSVGKTLTCVIVNAGEKPSKRYYKKAFTGENTHAPDCASANGETPDSGITEPVCGSCDECQKNAWGSRAGFTGKKAKACQEYRRLVICVTDEEGNHDLYRLDVPAASLNNLRVYGSMLTMHRVPISAVLTQISFDATATYQRLKFDAVQAFTKEDFKIYKAIGQSDEAVNMLTMQSSTETDAVEEIDDDEEGVEPPETVRKKVVKKSSKTVLNAGIKSKAAKPVPKRKKVKKVIEVYEDDEEEVVEENDVIEVNSAEELESQLDAELQDDLD